MPKRGRRECSPRRLSDRRCRRCERTACPFSSLLPLPRYPSIVVPVPSPIPAVVMAVIVIILVIMMLLFLMLVMALVVIPLRLMVPVAVPLPGPPVVLHSSIGHALMTRRHGPVVTRQVPYCHRRVHGGLPRPVVAQRDVPRAAVGPVPAVMVEHEVRIHVGRRIDIGPADNDECGRRRKDKRGQRHPDIDVHIDLRRRRAWQA